MNRLVACGFAASICAAAGLTDAGRGSGPIIRGEEQGPQVCIQIWQPVCGTDRAGKRVTYSNECFARAANATNVTPGECRR